MTLTQRWHDIRTGFERPFWVANISELFERLSYYAAFASLARYLHEPAFPDRAGEHRSPASSADWSGSSPSSAERWPTEWASVARCRSRT